WVVRDDPAFPSRLRSIHDPPPGLFVRGEAPLDLLERPSVAVVGARACSSYGSSVATSLARELTAAGVVVVSGLARGVDAAAHRGALQSGLTVAVLGCGIDRDYPRAHASLAVEIARASLLVSEYPPGVEPAPWRFPARNRIVAGLALATVVVEARERSGALITADLALDEGREVLAVPGEITSHLSQGTNALLRLGATPVTCAADVLVTIGIEPAPSPAPPALVGPAARVRAVVADAPVGADEIVRRTGLDAGEVAAALVELELLGLVGQADGVYREVMPRGAGSSSRRPSRGGSCS
ncbi:MAG TPA: DNA-processing protein DprA, partial [Gaiellaceae bacterium]